jgi:hypothetical protein
VGNRPTRTGRLPKAEAITFGYRLHEGPAVTFNGEQVIVAQALLWPGTGDLPEG